jgi:hypothetical protein
MSDGPSVAGMEEWRDRFLLDAENALRAPQKEVKKKSIGSAAKHKLTTDLGEAARPDRLNRVLGWLQQSIQRRIGSSINFRGRSVLPINWAWCPTDLDGCGRRSTLRVDGSIVLEIKGFLHAMVRTEV